MPQRSPFAIQELLGLSDSHHRSPTAAVSAITPNVYPQRQAVQPPTCFPSDPSFNHHHMTMAASRMAYFNAQAAVAAAFLPHNIAAAAGMSAGMSANPAAGSPAAVLGLAAHSQQQPPGKSTDNTTFTQVKGNSSHDILVNSLVPDISVIHTHYEHVTKENSFIIRITSVKPII